MYTIFSDKDRLEICTIFSVGGGNIEKNCVAENEKNDAYNCTKKKIFWNHTVLLFMMNNKQKLIRFFKKADKMKFGT